MLRELSTTLLDLHAGFEAMAVRATTRYAAVRVTGLEVSVPVDLAMIFAGGGCRLLADVPRTRSEGALAAPASQLMVRWAECPVSEVLGDVP